MRFLALISLMAVVACGSAEKLEILVGERINIPSQKETLEPNPTAAAQRMYIPGSLKNHNWGQTGGNSSHNPQHLFLPEQVKRAWTADVGEIRGHVVNSPVVHSGRLFVMNSNNQITALNAQSGKRLWRKRLEIKKGEINDFTGGLAVEGDRLFATTANGQVFALSASEGEMVWKVTLDAPLRAAPTIIDETLVVVSHDNRLFVLDVRQGNLLWTHSGMAENLTLASGASPAVAQGVVLAPYTSGDLYALNLENGQHLWNASLNTALVSYRSRETISGISAAPIISGNDVIAVSVSGALSSYDITTGKRMWQSSVGTSQTPWVAGTAVFALMDDGRLIGMNRKDGQIRWITNLNDYLEEKNSNRYWSGPVLAGTRLIMASSDGYALSIHPLDGRKLLAVQLFEHDGVSVPPIVAGSNLYFLTDKGKVVCFR